MYEDIFCTQSVTRKIPGRIRVIQGLLYAAVAVFTVIGAMEGAFWMIPALGTLFGAWYFMGAARVNYEYRLEGTHFTVERVSGLRSKRKAVLFGDFDLTKLIIMAPEGDPALAKAEADSLAGPARRITYDVSAHDPDDICSLMYLTGVGKELDRPLKVYFQPGPELRECIRKIAPDRVAGYDRS